MNWELRTQTSKNSWDYHKYQAEIIILTMFWAKMKFLNSCESLRTMMLPFLDCRKNIRGKMAIWEFLRRGSKAQFRIKLHVAMRSRNWFRIMLNWEQRCRRSMIEILNSSKISIHQRCTTSSLQRRQNWRSLRSDMELNSWTRKKNTTRSARARSSNAENWAKEKMPDCANRSSSTYKRSTAWSQATESRSRTKKQAIESRSKSWSNRICWRWLSSRESRKTIKEIWMKNIKKSKGYKLNMLLSAQSWQRITNPCYKARRTITKASC